MAKYEIYYKNVLYGCGGCEESIEGQGEVELTDDDVQAIADLLQKYNGNADNALADVKTSRPDIYSKLDEAYKAVAYEAEEHFWLLRGYEDRAYDRDFNELMEYCKKNCGFECNTDDEDEEMDEFSLWLTDYIFALSPSECKKFANEQLFLEPELSDVEYEVVIPEDITTKYKIYVC